MVDVLVENSRSMCFVVQGLLSEVPDLRFRRWHFCQPIRPICSNTLCDPGPDVRDAAGRARGVLPVSAGGVQEIHLKARPRHPRGRG